jgi:acyl-CoA reductase-like NAD-dependent aldehyde dehydrogenase
VAPVVPISSLEQAIELTNASPYGLLAAIFTGDVMDGLRFADQVHTGLVNINETTNYWDQMAPFGGAKKSGAGRELAGWILDALTETKQITFELG